MKSSIHRLKIGIDPRLKGEHGPEIYWVWRLLLSGIGYGWQEVSSSANCDISYGVDTHPQGSCRMYIRANTQKWKNKSDLRLKTVGEFDRNYYPIYDIEQNSHLAPFAARDACVTCERDIVFDIFWLATGQEERYWPKNQHGHFDLDRTVFAEKNVGRLAVATSIACWLEKTLESLGFPKPVPRWPNSKRAAVCLGHDVDYPEVIRSIEPLRVIRRLGLRAFPAAVSVLTGRRKHWHFSSWVDLEKSFGARSAFYFVARRGSLLEYAFGTPDPFYDIQSDGFRRVFHYLADQGFEIGLHASYRAFTNTHIFVAEKSLLTEVSGQQICGNRHHYWHLKPEDPESTLLIHELAGIKYDASLTHERYIGWRRGLSWPFFPFHQKRRRELKTLQISTSWMDDQLFGHQQNNPGDRLALLQALTDTAVHQGGCMHIDVHDYVYDEVLFPDWAATYRALLEYVVDRSDIWLDAPSAIANHWIERSETIRHASRGLDGTFTH